jgi:hypothetical protein
VIRLSRAGREQAIINAIRKLNATSVNKMHTRGEICRVMGIKSTSRIRDMLRDMESYGRLVGATTAIDGYADEIAIYGIPEYRQVEMPRDHEIIINGVSCRMAEGWN